MITTFQIVELSDNHLDDHLSQPVSVVNLQIAVPYIDKVVIDFSRGCRGYVRPSKNPPYYKNPSNINVELEI